MITIVNIIRIIALVILVNVLLQFLFCSRQRKFLSLYGGNEDRIARNIKVKIQQRSWYDFFECDVIVIEECLFLLSRKEIFGFTLYQGIHQLSNYRNRAEKFIYVTRRWVYNSLEVEGNLITIDVIASKQSNIALVFDQHFDVADFLNRSGIIS